LAVAKVGGAAVLAGWEDDHLDMQHHLLMHKRSRRRLHYRGEEKEKEMGKLDLHFSYQKIVSHSQPCVSRVTSLGKYSPNG
jgi:hypothetical protein